MDELVIEILLGRIEKLSAQLAIAEAYADEKKAENPELDKARAHLAEFMASPTKIRLMKVYRDVNPGVSLRDTKDAVEASVAFKILDGSYEVPVVNVEWSPGMPTETDNPEDDILHLWAPPGI